MSEVVVAVQEGSRGELHPPGQLCQPPDEAGMWWGWGPPKAGPHACWSWGLGPRLLHPAQPRSRPWGAGWEASPGHVTVLPRVRQSPWIPCRALLFGISLESHRARSPWAPRADPRTAAASRRPHHTPSSSSTPVFPRAVHPSSPFSPAGPSTLQLPSALWGLGSGWAHMNV